MGDYFDKDGNPIDLYEWARKHEDFEYRSVANNENSRWRVSTVWLGLDHNFHDDGPPLIFESMVFPANPNDWSDQDCRRYSTFAEAEAGHAELVREWLTDDTDPED